MRIATIHAILLDLRIFILQKQGEGRFGWGVGVNEHAYRYVFILPLFVGVEASLGDHFSSRRFTFDRRECLVEPPAL